MNENSLKQQAWALLNADNVENAKNVCQQICTSETADAETFYLLGSCHAKLGDFKEAVTAFERSLDLQPSAHQSRFSLASALLRAHQFEDAVAHFKLLIKAKSNLFKAFCLLGDALCYLGKYNDAPEYYKKAIELQPKSGWPHIGLGNIAMNSINDTNNQLKHLQTAINLEPNNPEYLCKLGSAFTAKQEYNDADNCYHQAMLHSPDYPNAIGGLAHIATLKGNYATALEYITVLRDKKILSSTAALAFCIICKHTGHCEDAVEYTKNTMKNELISTKGLEALHMHLARTLDSMKLYNEAWQYFISGNKLTETLYDTVMHQLRTDNMIESFSQANLMKLRRSSIDSKRPIFIVGMPRSGTSLVEQIMASHPDVAGGGELKYISDLRMTLNKIVDSEEPWPNNASALTESNFNEIANIYLDQINGISNTAKRITDKMPHNFFELGLIQLLFPEAQIIHCKRDPMDTSLSIFFQNFLDGHEYARNLYHIGTHYHQYVKLMEHWNNFLSIPILNVEYETLVSEPEDTVRKMLKHCNLDWHEDCLNFHKAKRIIKTASFDQVRQPINTKSVQRWRNYEPHLDDLKNGLKNGI